MKPKSLPPWLQDKDEKGPPPKGTKVSGVKGPKGAVTKVSVPVKKADGGKVATGVQNKPQPKSAARSDPKMAGNAKGNTLHLKDGGKARC